MTKDEKLKLRLKHCSNKSEQKLVRKLMSMSIKELKSTEAKYRVIAKKNESKNDWAVSERKQVFTQMELLNRGYHSVTTISWKKGK